MVRELDEEITFTSSLVLSAVLLLLAAGAVLDIKLDRAATLWTGHVLLDVGLVTVSAGCVVYLWWRWRRASLSLSELRRELLGRQAALQAERESWQTNAQASIEGLSRAIARQFNAWALTPTEREIALLVLKGYSHKQAAALTGRSERTVRQHAVSVYKKAGLSGRAELAAFFLGDLLLPKLATDSATAPVTITS